MNKVIVITGTGKGIGKALAIGLSRKNCAIIASGRNVSRLESLQDRLIGTFLLEPCDISKWEDAIHITYVLDTLDENGKLLKGHYNEKLQDLMKQLLWWTQALKAAREKDTPQKKEP